MDDRGGSSRPDLRDAADVACGDHARLDAGNVGDLAVAERLCDLGLQDVVGPRGAAAEVRLGNRAYFEAGAAKERLRRIDDLQGVLERAGRVVGVDERLRRHEIDGQLAGGLADVPW